MRDFLENMEAAAERRLDEMTQPCGKLKCGCGKLFAMEDGETVSSNPYAMPVCPQCFQEWLEQINKKGK